VNNFFAPRQFLRRVNRPGVKCRSAGAKFGKIRLAARVPRAFSFHLRLAPPGGVRVEGRPSKGASTPISAPSRFSF
jgi:hypothetical protein